MCVCVCVCACALHLYDWVWLIVRGSMHDSSYNVNVQINTSDKSCYIIIYTIKKTKYILLFSYLFTIYTHFRVSGNQTWYSDQNNTRRVMLKLFATHTHAMILDESHGFLSTTNQSTMTLIMTHNHWEMITNKTITALTLSVQPNWKREHVLMNPSPRYKFLFEKTNQQFTATIIMHLLIFLFSFLSVTAFNT